jgi:hypothetical protein
MEVAFSMVSNTSQSAVGVAWLDCGGWPRNAQVRVAALVPSPSSLLQGDEMGAGLAPVGDVNDDGVGDLVAGAPGWAVSTGAAYLLFMQRNGSSSSFSLLKYASVGEDPLAGVWGQGNRCGSEVASLGDKLKMGLDGHGAPDVALGCPGHHAGAGGVLLLFLNSEGGVNFSAVVDNATASTPLNDMSGFAGAGSGLATFPSDVDGNGVVGDVLAVGAPGDNAVFLLGLAADGSVRWSRTLNEGTVHRSGAPTFAGALHPGSRFGARLTGVEVDGAGAGTLLVHVENSTQGNGSLPGSFWVIALDGGDGTGGLLLAPNFQWFTIVDANTSSFDSQKEGPGGLLGDSFGHVSSLLGDITGVLC